MKRLAPEMSEVLLAYDKLGSSAGDEPSSIDDDYTIEDIMARIREFSQDELRMTDVYAFGMVLYEILFRREPQIGKIATAGTLKNFKICF